MGVDINTWRARIGNSCGLLNAIAVRKGKMHSTLHDIKTTEHRRKTRGALFWIGLALVVTLSIVTFVCLHSDSTSMTSGNPTFLFTIRYQVPRSENNHTIIWICPSFQLLPIYSAVYGPIATKLTPNNRSGCSACKSAM